MIKGTIFTPKTVTSPEQVREFIIANFTPPLVPPQRLAEAADELLRLYPVGDPALGSPFNTGNNTFGVSPVFKTAAALGSSFLQKLNN